MYHKKPETKPEDFIPRVTEDQSKFKVTVSFDFEFDWNSNFAGQSYREYDGWGKLFNSSYDEFKTALFMLILNDSADQLRDYYNYNLTSGKLLSYSAGKEVEKIYNDFHACKLNEQKAAKKLKAEELKKQAKELMEEAKKLENA